MGCVTSKHRLNQHPNIFSVMNINDSGQVISPGQIEVTENELVFHQKGKESTRWPLSYLRKYGYDSDLFTFESGRRCPTGHGIYAFRCRKAEQLFNLLQQNLNIGNHTTPSVNHTTPVEPVASTGPPVTRPQPEGYLNPVSNTSTVRSKFSISRPGSMNSSNGPISPSTISPPPSANDITFEHNNNKRGSLIPDHTYTNTNIFSESDNTLVPYINLSPGSSPTLPSENYVNLSEANSPLYMNVTTGDNSLVTQNPTKDIPNVPMSNYDPELSESSISEHEQDRRHCYANINTSELENLKSLNTIMDIYPTNSVPQTPTNNPPSLVYLQLDLVPSTTDKPIPANSSTLKAESPDKNKKSYVKIDFLKTNAISHINNRREPEEGVRKTRHNSTIESSSTKQRSSFSD